MTSSQATARFSNVLRTLPQAGLPRRSKLEVKLKYFPELDPFVVGRDQEIDRLASLLETETGGIVQLVALGGAGKTSLVQRFLEARAAPLAAVGYRQVFGCSFYRADIGQFIHDMAIATVDPLALPLPERADRICKYVESNRVLLVLDGVEAILDDRSQLTNPYIARIVESVLRGVARVSPPPGFQSAGTASNWHRRSMSSHSRQMRSWPFSTSGG